MATTSTTAADLPRLDPEMEQIGGVCTAHHVLLDDLLLLFDDSVHEAIRTACTQDGATHVVCFENLDMWASQFGHRTALVVGSKQTFKLEDVLRHPGFRLGSVPSRFQYPVAYAANKMPEPAEDDVASPVVP